MLIRYADDFVAGFQYRADAERYGKQLKERLSKYGLEIAEEKSKIIEFGRKAWQKGVSKVETFDFLGFTHY